MKKKALLGLFALLMASLLLLSACGGGASTPAASGASAQSGASGAQQEGSNVFRVGMECDYPPFNWTQLDDSNGAVPLSDGTYAGGYDVEIAKLIAEKLGKKLEIVKVEWDGLPAALTSGKIDAIIAGMTDTPERRQTLDFTDYYYSSDLVIVVKADGPYANAATLADFDGAKITGQMGTFHYDVIDQIPNVNKQPAMETFPTMVAALTSGMIDGYVSERPGALSAVASNSSLTYIEFAEGEGFDFDQADVTISIGVRKGDTELKDGINAALAEISDETREQLMVDALNNQPLAG